MAERDPKYFRIVDALRLRRLGKWQQNLLNDLQLLWRELRIGSRIQAKISSCHCGGFDAFWIQNTRMVYSALNIVGLSNFPEIRP
jgi:hypothetical protein